MIWVCLIQIRLRVKNNSGYTLCVTEKAKLYQTISVNSSINPAEE
jgi:hypothetical protein